MESTGLASHYSTNLNYYQKLRVYNSRNLLNYQLLTINLKQLDVQLDVKISTGNVVKRFEATQ